MEGYPTPKIRYICEGAACYLRCFDQRREPAGGHNRIDKPALPLARPLITVSIQIGNRRRDNPVLPMGRLKGTAKHQRDSHK